MRIEDICFCTNDKRNVLITFKNGKEITVIMSSEQTAQNLIKDISRDMT